MIKINRKGDVCARTIAVLQSWDGRGWGRSCAVEMLKPGFAGTLEFCCSDFSSVTHLTSFSDEFSAANSSMAFGTYSTP